MQITLILLRLIHIVLGAIWVGTAVFIALFVEPSARALGVAGGQMMAELGRRKFHVWMSAFGGLTVLTGIILLGWNSDWFRNAWLRTPQGIVFQVGGTFAILSMIVGVAVSRPTVTKLGELMPKAAQMAAGPERDAIQQEAARLSARLTMAARAVALLVVLAVACMAAARYV
jgi:hypothetical protein